jgi:hypothetical protein
MTRFGSVLSSDDVTLSGGISSEQATKLANIADYADRAHIAVEAVASSPIARTDVPTADDTDDVQLAADDYVFLVGQSSALNNGVWVIKAGSWVRPAEAPAASTVRAGLEVYVLGGTTNAGRIYRLGFDAVVGTGSQSWQRDEQSAEETPLESGSGDITETNVQGGIEGLDSRLIAHRADTSAIHPASGITTNAPSGQASWTDVQVYLAGLKALVDAGGGGSGVSLLDNNVYFAHIPGGFTETPTAVATYPIRNNSLHTQYYNSTYALSVRLIIRAGTPTTGTLVAHLQYSSNLTNWFYIDGTADGSTPTTSVNVTPAGSTTNISTLVTLPAGAKGALHWRIVWVGGDATKTVNYSFVYAQFVPDVQAVTPDIEIEWVDRIAFQPNDLIDDQFSGVWYPSIGRPARLDAIKVEVDQAASANPTQLKLHRVTNNGTLASPSSSTQIYPTDTNDWTSVAATFSRSEKTSANGEGLPLTLGEHDRFQLERGTVGTGVSMAWMVLKGVWL